MMPPLLYVIMDKTVKFVHSPMEAGYFYGGLDTNGNQIWTADTGAVQRFSSLDDAKIIVETNVLTHVSLLEITFDRNSHRPAISEVFTNRFANL